jgi:hypothetical protein
VTRSASPPPASSSPSLHNTEHETLSGQGKQIQYVPSRPDVLRPESIQPPVATRSRRKRTGAAMRRDGAISALKRRLSDWFVVAGAERCGWMGTRWGFM